MAIKRGAPSNKKFKRHLRTEMPEPERRLWSRLRSRQFHGLRFRRQHGIGPYIVDFFCPERKLVIEVDGDTHGENDQIKKDEKRDAYLKSLGAVVIRYANADIMTQLDGVLEDLKEKVNSLSTSPSPPYKGGGSDSPLPPYNGRGSDDR